MPLILEPERHSRETLATLVRELADDLDSLAAAPVAPGVRVRDPSSLVTVAELLAAVRATIDRSAERSAGDLARDANLAYATMLAVIDLVKSHADVPRVPAPRRTDAPA